MMRGVVAVGTSSVQVRKGMLPLAAGTAVAVWSLTGSVLGTPTFTWIGNPATVANRNFSVGSNWQGNTAPVLGTTASPVNLNFYSGNAGAIVATNDLGTPWVANNLTFNINSANNFTLAGTAVNNVFQLAGGGATLASSGLGNAVMANNAGAPTGAQLQLAADVTFGGTGTGNLILQSDTGTSVSETNGSHKITISGGAPLRILRTLALNGANTFTGGVVLNGGTVQIGTGTDQFGPAGSTLTVNAAGGAVNVPAITNSLSLGTLQLNGDLHLIGNNFLSLTNSTTSAPAVIQGSGHLSINTANGGLTIAGNSNTYTGGVVIDHSEIGLSATNNAGALTLTSIAGPGRSAEGSITGAASIEVRAGGSLVLKNNTANSLQNGDRISDTAPLRLRTATIELDGPAPAGTNGYTPANLTERCGNITGAGNNTIYVFNNASVGVVTTLEAGSLSRGTERGTFSFRSNAATMGNGAAASHARVILDTPIAGSEFVGGGGAAGSTNINILPWGAGGVTASDNGSTFVTYGADGFRPLTSAEYVADNLSPSDPTSNVMLTTSQAGPGSGNDTTMNSLVLSKVGSSGASVTGSGRLHITSGAVMFAGTYTPDTPNFQTISADLDFGAREGIVWEDSFGGGGMITGQLYGSGGFTKAGNGNSANVLVLTGDNSNLTGPLNINAGYLQYMWDLAVPGTGQIVVNGAGVSSSTSGPAAGFYQGSWVDSTFSRDVAINTGALTFMLKNSLVNPQVRLGNLTITGTISGVGDVIFSPQVVGWGEIFVTNTSNTYTGTTYFGSGRTHVAADGSTGAGGAWELAGVAVVVAEGDITNSRVVNIEAQPTIDTLANSVTLNGPITSFGAGWDRVNSSAGLTKAGTGTLTLTNAINTLTGAVTVNEGTLAINGNLGPSSAATSIVTVSPGAFLRGSGTIYRKVQLYSSSTDTPGGGTLSPGGANPGILTIWGNLDMAPTSANGGPASTLSIRLNGPNAGTGYDQVQTFQENAAPAAQVSLGDGATTQQANLSLSLGYAPSSSDVFWLITSTNKYAANLGTPNTTTGAFAGLPEGSTVALGTYGGIAFTGTISYRGDLDANNPAAGTGNDVVIYNIRGGCGSADFNCDGDTATDADIEAFFACLAGACPPPPCASTADFNGDGDVATDADIEAFFRVLAGGTC
jgi:autotransporter-associated beta strand protein